MLLNRWSKKKKQERGYVVAKTCGNCGKSISSTKTIKGSFGYYEVWQRVCLYEYLPVDDLHTCVRWEPRPDQENKESSK